MVGRLARYLRFVGCDTRYARGISDEEILRLARAEDRVIVTRDRLLAQRAPRAVLLESVHIEGQWKALRAAMPELPATPRFERCSLCNGVLEPHSLSPTEPVPDGLPSDRVRSGLPLFRCRECGHFYWEGSHTSRVRRDLARWSLETSA
jgi:uncharacterized protein